MNTHHNFAIQQIEDSLAVQTLNTIIYFFKKNTLYSNFERALKGTGS